MTSSREMTSQGYTDDADVTLTEEILTGSRDTSRRRFPIEPGKFPCGSSYFLILMILLLGQRYAGSDHKHALFP